MWLLVFFTKLQAGRSLASSALPRSSLCITWSWLSHLAAHLAACVLPCIVEGQQSCLECVAVTGSAVAPQQVEAVQSVCPDVTEAEALKALELCGDKCVLACLARAPCMTYIVQLTLLLPGWRGLSASLPGGLFRRHLPHKWSLFG